MQSCKYSVFQDYYYSLNFRQYTIYYLLFSPEIGLFLYSDKEIYIYIRKNITLDCKYYQKKNTIKVSIMKKVQKIRESEINKCAACTYFILFRDYSRKEYVTNATQTLCLR